MRHATVVKLAPKTYPSGTQVLDFDEAFGGKSNFGGLQGMLGGSGSTTSDPQITIDRSKLHDRFREAIQNTQSSSGDTTQPTNITSIRPIFGDTNIPQTPEQEPTPTAPTSPPAPSVGDFEAGLEEGYEIAMQDAIAELEEEAVYEEAGVNDDNIGDWIGEAEQNNQMPFDGVMGAEDRYAEMDGDNYVNPHIQAITDQIEANKKAISDLRVNRARALGMGLSVSEIDGDITAKTLRIRELKDVLKQYITGTGSFKKNEQGVVSFFSGDEPSGYIGDRKTRIIEINKAVVISRQNLDSRYDQLPPEFSTQRLYTPADQHTERTGLNGLDQHEDFDAPAIREVRLGADGSKSKRGSAKDIAMALLLVGGVFVAMRIMQQSAQGK